MKLIDIHCHIQHEKYKDIESVIREASEKMEFIVVSGASSSWNSEAVRISEENDFVYSTIGIHPIDCVKMSDAEFNKEMKYIISQVNNKKVVAIGEIGLDYYWFKKEAERELQKKRFLEQIKIARDHGLPIVIHSRDAESETLDILEKENVRDVVMHCFAGKRDSLERSLKNGYYISVSTNIARSKSIKKIARDTPLDKLLIETDAPYMSPVQGEINYPWNTSVVLNKISEIKKIPEEEILKIVIENAKRIFKRIN